jgi:hypothetical protein
MLTLDQNMIKFRQNGWHAPKLLKRPKGGPRMKQREKKVGAHSLTRKTSGVEGMLEL